MPSTGAVKTWTPCQLVSDTDSGVANTPSFTAGLPLPDADQMLSSIRSASPEVVPEVVAKFNDTLETT